MITSENMKNRMNMISEMKNESTFQILEYDNLQGAMDLNTALQINLMKDSSIRLKQIRIILDDSEVKIEAGALSYMKGDIEIVNKTGGIIGLGKKFFSSKVTGESMFKPVLRGTGEVFLEPSFGHFTLIELEDEEIIIDDELFYACEEGIEVEPVMQKSISSMIFGKEGIYQTRLRGSGIVVLEIPVPEKEIFRCKLFRDVLKIDGNFAILRSGNIEFTVEKSGTTLVGTALNGEGLLNVYRGTGEVWLVPTESIYSNLKERGLRDLEDIEKEDIDE
ncbi:MULTISPECIES: AIM24 family protein [unclassified Clostridium]|uniref:AIM24 family protein n=1 Tax=unclassified Clostridium TaxID=2614128 RepID=UPI0025D6D26D|nr:AIM24 family protein [Clostridium sp.]MCI6692151.1 AIM24 family protein [Clostridium sp.]MDY2632884.1 AIM24 family protein [Clostridium sp.]MDY4252357.1 AIM24 family protein [Clostridium sp.]MDY6226092.1 AIM24 family protein [Clostridium sp.]